MNIANRRIKITNVRIFKIENDGDDDVSDLLRACPKENDRWEVFHGPLLVALVEGQDWTIVNDGYVGSFLTYRVSEDAFREASAKRRLKEFWACRIPVNVEAIPHAK